MGGHMSNDNLILFPNKRTSNISMSESEAKWMVSGSLLVVLTLAIGINSTLFAGNSLSNSSQLTGSPSAIGSRSIASTNPIIRVSWEKRAFQVLETAKLRDLANVGASPGVFDNFAFGTLEGDYSIRKVDGMIAEIQFARNPESRPKELLERKDFLSKNLALFSDQAKSVKKIHTEKNQDRLVERFQLKGPSGQDLGVIQVLLDQDQNLLSMTVQ